MPVRRPPRTPTHSALGLALLLTCALLAPTPALGADTGVHPDGALVRGPDGARYLLQDAKRRLVPSDAVLASQLLNPAKTRTATAGDLSLALGSPLTLRPGSLVQGSTNSVYLIDEINGATVKRGIVSGEVLLGLGYGWNEILNVPDSQLPPNGPLVSDTSQHVTGTLIQNSGSLDIYLIDHGRRRRIPTDAILTSWGFPRTAIRAATTTDQALPTGADLPLREGTIAAATTSVYAIDITTDGTPTRRGFPDPDTFLGLGYDWSEILHVSPTDLPTTNGTPLSTTNTPPPPDPTPTPTPPPDPGDPNCPLGNVAARPPAFPLGAWQAPSASFATWRARGLNTMVYTLDGLSDSTPFSEWQRRLQCQDLYAIRPPMQSLAQENADARLLALSQPDEPDIRPIAQARLAPNYASWKSGAPSKPVFMDLSGDNVFFGSSGKQAYQDLMANTDWVGHNLYPIAGYNRPDWVDLSQTAIPPNASVLDTLQNWSGSKPHYAFIEASNLNGPPYRSPTPDELRGEVWDAVIHGARGVFYYVAGPSGDDSVESGVAAEMTRQDALMSGMGPILAQPGARQSAPAPFEVATRSYCGRTYTIVLNFSHQAASYNGRGYAPYEVSVSPAPPNSASC